MRMQLDRWRVPVRAGIALLAGIVFTACSSNGPRPPEPQPGCPRGRAPETQAELNACLNGAAFDYSYEAGDEQPLAVIDTAPAQPSPEQACPGDTAGSRLTCRYGPLAKFQPLIGAHLYSEEELMQGRFIARISVPSTAKEGYKKYGLVPGDTTYWWVMTDKTRRAGQSVFITVSARGGGLQQVTRPLTRELDADSTYKDSDPGARESKYRPDKLPKWRRAIVRWLWSLNDETAKGKCGSGSCS